MVVSDDITKRMGEYLLKGYTMLTSSCTKCPEIPLMRLGNGKSICVKCEVLHTKEASQTVEGEDSNDTGDFFISVSPDRPDCVVPASGSKKAANTSGRNGKKGGDSKNKHSEAARYFLDAEKPAQKKPNGKKAKDEPKSAPVNEEKKPSLSHNQSRYSPAQMTKSISKIVDAITLPLAQKYNSAMKTKSFEEYAHCVEDICDLVKSFKHVIGVVDESILGHQSIRDRISEVNHKLWDLLEHTFVTSEIGSSVKDQLRVVEMITAGLKSFDHDK